MGRDIEVCETILALSGTTNGRLAVESFAQLEGSVGRPLVQIPEDRADERITFADITTQPRKVIASAEWSGLESRERRYSPFTANVEHLIPWRTLTGRQQLYVDHEWMLDLGEGLPAYRPPVDAGQLVGLGGAPDAEEALEITVRYMTPHSKWSIHSEFQDNLHMLTLFRGGPAMWLSSEDAERIDVADNDWLEVYNKHGTVACRAVVSHRIPNGVAFYYHSQDRHVNVPVSEISGARGGTDNSLTRISIKPSHLIGGYAQLSWGFNYYGADRAAARPADHRPQAALGGGVLMRVRAQMGMVMNLDKCIGCHTCSVTCKNVWTNRRGAEYVWFNNVETKPGRGYPRDYEDQERWHGGWKLDRKGRLKLRAGRQAAEAAQHLLEPRPPRSRRLLRALELRLREPDRRAGGGPATGRPAPFPGLRQEARSGVGAELGGRSGGLRPARGPRPQPPRSSRSRSGWSSRRAS